MGRTVAAIVMASGFSKRMGQDKLKMFFEGDPLLIRTIKRLQEAGIEQIICVVREPYWEPFLEALHVKVCYNEKAYLGQSESIKAGLTCLMDAFPFTEGILFVPADMPYMTTPVIQKLTQLYANGRSLIVTPICQGIRRAPVIFDVLLTEDLMTLMGDQGGKALFSKYAECIDELIIEEENVFQDIDTPEDLGL